MKKKTASKKPAPANQDPQPAPKRRLPELIITPDADGVCSYKFTNCDKVVVDLPSCIKTLKANAWRWGIIGIGTTATIAPHLGLSARSLENALGGRPVSLAVMFRLQAYLNKMEAAHHEIVRKQATMNLE